VVRSVRESLAVAACLCLLGAGASGCSTTQDKAAAQKAKSEHILEAQAERKAAKKREKANKAQHGQGKQRGKGQ
jgi:hypothetical protein